MLAANIAKVNGLVFSTAPAFTGLLDTYTGAAAAYSTRRLYSLYTGAALRVREDSGDTETDIGFDSNGDLDTAAIATHCGSANGYVTKWYGQESSGGTGSGNDAEQLTSGSQPQIYNGSAVITENGKPALDCDKSSDQHLSFSTSTLNGKYPDLFMVLTVDSYSQFGTMVLSQTTSGNYYTQLGTSSNFYVQASSVAGSGVNVADGQQRLVELYADGTDINAVYDGVAYSRTTGTSAYPSGTLTFRIGRHTNTNWNLDGQLQEYIIWPDNQTSSNRTGIEGNINAHFQIGNFGTPTSGLLATYTGAAAAYSVRQLANTAALAMRIREDGTDTETDIGFDSNGDLDTAAISSHCGANNGYVVTWYDQSGEQNDATQGTTTSQPQIYNGTAVLTENGKPALEFDGSNDVLESASFVPLIRTASQVMTKSASTGSSTIWRHNEGDIQFTRIRFTTSFQTRNIGTTATSALNTQAVAICHTQSDITTSGTAYTYYNGTETSASNASFSVTSSGPVFIGNSSATGAELWLGTIQEVVLWTTYRYSDNTAIQSNVNTYFSIY